MSHPAPPDEPDDLLLFAPVATAYRGANGWSSAVRRAFVGALARCGTVAAAARSVGRDPRSAYRLRARAGQDSGFARAWDEARRRGSEEALDASMAGGMTARRTEVFHRGRAVGRRTAYHNRLAYAAPRAFDRQDAFRARQGIDATMLLGRATELPNGRATRASSPGCGGTDGDSRCALTRVPGVYFCVLPRRPTRPPPAPRPRPQFTLRARRVR